jgi:hypothetical protein
MIPKKINAETLEIEQRWANVIGSNNRETLRNLQRIQREEGERQSHAWLKNEYYDIEDDEDAD